MAEQKRGGSKYFYKPIPEKINTELAYIVGVLLGDGSLTKTTRSDGRVEQYIWLASIDKEFTEFFLKCVLSVIKSGKDKPRVFRRKYEDPRSDEWAISLYINREWYNFLNKAITNKEDFVSELNDESLRWWLKGFCDSEANVDPAGREGKYVQIQIYNSDRKICELVKSCFESLGYSPEIYEKDGFASCYRVCLQKTYDVLKYDQEIGFTIKRKSKALEKAVSRHREKAEFLREKYKKFKRLKQKGTSLREIEKTIGISRHSLSNWNKESKEPETLPEFYEMGKYIHYEPTENQNKM